MACALNHFPRVQRISCPLPPPPPRVRRIYFLFSEVLNNVAINFFFRHSNSIKTPRVVALYFFNWNFTLTATEKADSMENSPIFVVVVVGMLFCVAQNKAKIFTKRDYGTYRVLDNSSASTAANVLTVCWILEDDSYFTSFNRTASAVDLAVEHVNKFIMPDGLKLRAIFGSTGMSCSHTMYSSVMTLFDFYKSGLICNMILGSSKCLYRMKKSTSLRYLITISHVVQKSNMVLQIEWTYVSLRSWLLYTLNALSHKRMRKVCCYLAYCRLLPWRMWWICHIILLTILQDVS